MAFSIAPLASTSAARQSLNPAPVLSRNSFTRCAGICIAGCCVLILFLSAKFSLGAQHLNFWLNACKKARSEPQGASLVNLSNERRPLSAALRRPAVRLLPRPRFRQALAVHL